MLPRTTRFPPHPHPVSMHLKEGDLLADAFRIERALGSGGTGRVYRARDLRRNRYVAVKVVQLAGTEPSFRQRVEREVKVLDDGDQFKG